MRLLGDALGWGKDLPAPSKSPRVEPGHLYHRERESRSSSSPFSTWEDFPLPPCVSVEVRGCWKDATRRELRGSCR